MGAALFHEEERRTDMTKLIDAFRHIANVPKKDEATKRRFFVDFQKFCSW